VPAERRDGWSNDRSTTARVHVNGDTYALPIPGAVNAEATTVTRPGFLGGPETRTTFELGLEQDEGNV
jgi:hypothetical protein